MYRITFLGNDNLPVGEAFYVNDTTKDGEDIKIFMDKLIYEDNTDANHDKYVKLHIRKLED